MPDREWSEGYGSEVCFCPMKTAVPEVTQTTRTMREYDNILERETGQRRGVVVEEVAKSAFMRAIAVARKAGWPTMDDERGAKILGWM